MSSSKSEHTPEANVISVKFVHLWYNGVDHLISNILKPAFIKHPHIANHSTRYLSMTDTLLRKIASRVKSGKAVPIISNVLLNDLVLGGHTTLVKKYSEHIHFHDCNVNLAYMTQFKRFTDENIVEAWDLATDYIYFIKTQLYDLAKKEGVSQDTLAEIRDEFDDLTFYKFAERLGYPKFSDGHDDPLLILADFQLPIYITTSYHGFIEAALREAGKEPRTEVCRWDRGLEDIPSVFEDVDYKPNEHEPLVYHLYGFDEYPDTMILTEDHYLQFLIAISEFRSQQGDRIAARIRQALTDSALILLGYNLSSWDFRALFLGLIRQRQRQRQSVCVQLKRSSEEERYLKGYLSKAQFGVHWGEIDEFLIELRKLVEG